MAAQSALGAGPRNELGRLARRPRALSSTGQSSELIIRWFRVRVPEGPPHHPALRMPRRAYVAPVFRFRAVRARSKKRRAPETGLFWFAAGYVGLTTNPNGLLRRRGLGRSGFRSRSRSGLGGRGRSSLGRSSLGSRRGLGRSGLFLLAASREDQSRSKAHGQEHVTHWLTPSEKGFELRRADGLMRTRTAENYPAFCALHKCSVPRKRMAREPFHQVVFRFARGCAES
jgi:hypothetical protein